MRRTAVALLTLAALAAGCPSPSVDKPDTGSPDTGTTKAPDSGVAPDAAATDATEPDAAAPDAMPPDGGGTEPDAAPSTDADPRIVDVVVAYAATSDQPLIAELFLTASSAQRTKVTPPLAGGSTVDSKGEPQIAGVTSFEWSHEGRGLLYVAEQDTYDLPHIYFAPTPGHVGTGTTSRLSVPSTIYEASYYDRLPNSDWIVFTQADEVTFGSLYATRTSTGTQPVRRLSQGRSATFRAASPTATQVVFQDIIVSAGDRDLWFADIDVVPPRTERINPGANLGVGSVSAWSPDGNEVLYVADEAGDRLFELFRVSVTNGVLGARTRVFAPSAMRHTFREGAYSADGSTIAFVGDLDTPNYGDLYTMPAMSPSPAPTKVTGAFAGSVLSAVDRHHFSPNGRLIMYAADQLRSVQELYVAQVGVADSGLPINGATGTGAVSDERWLDDTHLLYLGGSDFADRHLYVVDVTGGIPSAPLQLPVEGVIGFELSRSERYLTARDVGGNVHVVNLAASPPTAVDLGSGRGWCWGADDALAVIAQVGDATTFDLYLVEDLTDPTSLFLISGPLVADGEVTGCAFPP